MIDITCPLCGTVYHTEERYIGNRIRCSRCGCRVPISSVVTDGVIVHRLPQDSNKFGKQAKKYPTWLLLLAALASVTLATTIVSDHKSTHSRVGRLQDFADADAFVTNYKADPYASTDDIGNLQVVEEEPSLPSGPPANKDPALGTARVTEQRPASYRSLPTGTRIEPDAIANGNGVLTIENGTREDAVVRLYDEASAQTVRWLYVRSGEHIRVKKIPPGIYRLAYTEGLNWDESLQSFLWQPSYNEFERTLEYLERRDEGRIQYKKSA